MLLHISLMSDDNGSNNLIPGVINTRLGSHCRIHCSSFALQIYHQVSEGVRGPRRPGGPRAPDRLRRLWVVKAFSVSLDDWTSQVSQTNNV